VVTGRDGVLAQMADVLTRVRSLGHKQSTCGREDGGVVDFEVDSIWNLLDG
jgi:hypothetical protein